MGDGTQEGQESPEYISGISGLIQISAGEYHSLGLLGRTLFFFCLIN